MKELSWNGYRWRLDGSADLERIRRVLEAFPDLDAIPGARRLKHNRLRTVYYIPYDVIPSGVPSGGPDGEAASTPAGRSDVEGELADSASWPRGCVIKAYRYHGWRQRLRYRVLRSRSEQEWLALRRLRTLELAAPPPLAIGERVHGGSAAGGGLVLGFLDRTRPLTAALRPAAGPKRWGLLGDFDLDSEHEPGESERELLAVAGVSVRRLHDAGAWHRDLHPGNLLVEPGPPGGPPRLWFIDLHSCQFLPRLPRAIRRRGVIDLLHGLTGVTSIGGMRVFLEAYGLDVLYGDTSAAAADRALAHVRGAIEARRRERIRSRSRRCFLPSTMFEVGRRRGERWWWRREYPVEALASLWAGETPGRELKRSARGRVVEADCAGRPVCVKQRRYSVWEGIGALLSEHRLRRAYAAGHALWVRGIPSPLVVALHERRRFGLVREAHLVTEWVTGGERLDRGLMARYFGAAATRYGGRESVRQRHDLARRIGCLVRELHAAGLYTHDLASKNVLVDASLRWGEGAGDTGSADGIPSLWLVDLDDLVLPNVRAPWRRLTPRRRRQNLAQIGNLPEGHVYTTDLLRAYRAYSGGRPDLWCRGEIHALRELLLDEHLRTLLKWEG